MDLSIVSQLSSLVVSQEKNPPVMMPQLKLGLPCTQAVQIYLVAHVQYQRGECQGPAIESRGSFLGSSLTGIGPASSLVDEQGGSEHLLELHVAGCLVQSTLIHSNTQTQPTSAPSSDNWYLSLPWDAHPRFGAPWCSQLMLEFSPSTHPRRWS